MIEPVDRDANVSPAEGIAVKRKTAIQQALKLLHEIADSNGDEALAAKVASLDSAVTDAEAGVAALDRRMNDGILQELTAISLMSAGLAKRDLSSVEPDVSEEILEFVHFSADTAREASRKLRELLVALGSDPDGTPFG